MCGIRFQSSISPYGRLSHLVRNDPSWSNWMSSTGGILIFDARSWVSNRNCLLMLRRTLWNGGMGPKQSLSSTEVIRGSFRGLVAGVVELRARYGRGVSRTFSMIMSRSSRGKDSSIFDNQ